mmetsp:Transcript_8716/g.11555  ORF Transcript_8716/g.11555 Transcript_8716/m.11555 type:complete len:126 (+) Transcript_8716:145-522(+)|eukprot:CAMPEP_0198141806 /NCGR_PEP_ID=MMETSP1443-20131203/4739_1 /TAXON_ID=186043 /ORGANISM="Entomoneis sp., Strain CCMP2396" /LENGTH=125 /DNA_ID=CAMNT_0043804657 /DNA_START=97 /DNA_END=477 /DNA_ORIENTATION=+
MSTLNLFCKYAKMRSIQNRPALLYRHIAKEIPKLLMIYSIVNFGEKNARKAVRSFFYERSDAKDPRVIKHLLNWGYYELEETMLQHKQKNHLLALLEARTDDPHFSKALGANATEEEFLNSPWLE